MSEFQFKFCDDWYNTEIDAANNVYFRWSKKCSTIHFSKKHEYKFLRVRFQSVSPNNAPKQLTITQNDTFNKVFDIPKDDWYILTLPIEFCNKISFSTQDVLSAQGDDRVLGFKFFEFIFESDSDKKSFFINDIAVGDIDSEGNVAKQTTIDSAKLTGLDLALIHTHPPAGVLYIGQYGTSGYATAAKGYIADYILKGVPISWEPLYFDNSVLGDDDHYNVLIKSVIHKRGFDNSCYDRVIFHCTPDIWPDLIKQYEHRLHGKRKIGFTTWETDCLPAKWVECINTTVDEVWCPSTYNKDVFIKSGVTIPIKVVPHVYLKKSVISKKNINLYSCLSESFCNTTDTYIFYNISELNERKGVIDLVQTYCSTFTKADAVRLILKVHYRDYTQENKNYCLQVLGDVIKKFGESAPGISIIVDNLSDTQLQCLHTIGDCYVTLTKSEGFGLTIFDAYMRKKTIIATGYGGHIDFLGSSYSGLVNYSLRPVVNMQNFSANYTENQNWAIPDLKHASEKMRNVYNQSK